MPLPIFDIAAPLHSALAARDHVRILLKAPTGSGKSTSVPSMLLDANVEGLILVIQPRRMAARMLASWVAQQRNSPLGHEVGYAVRFDSNYQANTRILFLTDGLFQRWIHDNPSLNGVGAVIFDEFHERRLAVDIALSRCLNLQESSRPDLKVIVMSATLDTDALAQFLNPSAQLTSDGRTHPVDILYRPDPTPTTDRRGGPPRNVPIWEKIARVCKEAIATPNPGNLLIFLPGTHEIRKTIDQLQADSSFREWDILPLYSSLPPNAQLAAIAPSPRKKIIVSTNVAETSLTIDGVRTVIDSGLARSATFDPRRGINTLLIQKISRASADQRAGRAGRTAPGQCFRLWSQADHARRDAFDTPEVHRLDLAEACLLLLASGLTNVRHFRWFDPPLEPSITRAENLLLDLGAINNHGELTEDGTTMASIPLDPRFSRLLLSGHRFNCLAETAFIAAAVQSDSIFSNRPSSIQRKDFIHEHDGSDFAGEWRAFQAAIDFQYDPSRCSQCGIQARAAREISQAFDRLHSLTRQFNWPWNSVDFDQNRVAIGHAMLASFSDQLAIRFNSHSLACKLVHQRRGLLDDQSCVKQAPAFVAADITEVEAREVIVHLRRATAIDPLWLESLFPDDLSSTQAVAWDESRRRVIQRHESRFRDLVLSSKDSDHHINLDHAAELLAAKVTSGELILKNWDHTVEQWTTRLNLLSTTMPELDLPSWTEDDQIAAIAQICHGAVSYKEIKDTQVWHVLNDWLSHPQRSALDSYCPTRITLANGQTAKITYEPSRDPHISIRVSHLFGVWETPTIANGKIPLLVHILTPGQKPWQMTKDLNSFWKSGYPQMKKELAGRYPRHPWPDDPKSWTPKPKTT